MLTVVPSKAVVFVLCLGVGLAFPPWKEHHFRELRSNGMVGELEPLSSYEWEQEMKHKAEEETMRANRLKAAANEAAIEAGTLQAEAKKAEQRALSAYLKKDMLQFMRSENSDDPSDMYGLSDELADKESVNDLIKWKPINRGADDEYPLQKVAQLIRSLPKGNYDPDQVVLPEQESKLEDERIRFLQKLLRGYKPSIGEPQVTTSATPYEFSNKDIPLLWKQYLSMTDETNRSPSSVDLTLVDPWASPSFTNPNTHSGDIKPDWLLDDSL